MTTKKELHGALQYLIKNKNEYLKRYSLAEYNGFIQRTKDDIQAAKVYRSYKI